MSITRITTDIPPDRVNFVISLIRADGGTFERKDEADGEVTIIATFPDAPKVAPAMAAMTDSEFKWMAIARKELGQAEIPGSASNKQILAYNATTHGGAETDAVPWCASFVNFCVEQAGLPGTGSKSARLWLTWGVEADDFVPGCIVILERGDPSKGKGHVGFYVGRESGRIRLLGGNQADRVSVASYDADRVIGRRVPKA